MSISTEPLFSGTFQPVAVPTLALLKALPNPQGAITMLGRNSPNDGMGGIYYWSDESSATGNDASVVTPTGYESTQGRWLLISLYTSQPIYNVLSYGATPDSATEDNATAFQAALDDAATNISVGGASRKTAIVYVPPGVYRLRSQIIVPSGVRLVGESQNSTYLWADPSYFPASTAIIKLGRVAEEGEQQNCSVEQLVLNCGSGLITGSIGVDLTSAQENCGVRDCSILLFRGTGIAVTSCANTFFQNLILDDYDQGSDYGIHMTGTGGDNVIDKATVLGKFTNSAVRIYNSHATVRGLHIEGDRSGGAALTYGLDVDTAVVTADNVSGHSTVTNLVRIKNDTSAGEKFIGLSLWGGGATNMVRDETDTTSTLTSASCSGRLGMYVSNNTSISFRDGSFKIRPTGDPSLTFDGLAIFSADLRGSGNVTVTNAVCSTAAAPTKTFRLGTYQFWVDNGGLLRVKNGAPSNSTDGTVVGTQT